MLSRFFKCFNKPKRPVLHIPDFADPGFYLGELVNANESETKLVKSAIALLNSLIKDSLFKKELEGYRFTSMNGFSNAHIVSMVCETAHPIHVKIFYGSYVQNYLLKTKAIDKADDDYVHLNRFYLFDAAEVAGSIIHERAHALGFHHASAKERTSVPYALGEIVTRFGRQK